LNTPPERRARRNGQMWSWLMWTGVACVSALVVIAYSSDALRALPSEVSGGPIAALATQHWLFFAVIAALILLVVRASAAPDGTGKTAAGTSYRYLFESSPLPMWVMEEGSWRIVEVNEAAIEQYGYRRDEFLNMTAVDLQVPEDRETFTAQLRDRDPAATAYSRCRHVTKAGDTIIADVTARPFLFAGRRARQVLAHDVTDRVRIEGALRESEERLRMIADNVPALIGYVDADQRYRFANKTYEEWSGVSPAEMVGRTLREVLGETDYEKVRNDVEAALSGRAVTAERPVHPAAREIIARVSYIPHVGHDGQVQGFYVLGYDITERRKSEEAVAGERALLRAVIDNVPDNIYVKDREFRYLLMNPAGLAVRGVRREEEVLGRTSADFYPAAVAETFDAEDRAVIASGKPLINRERSHAGAEGALRWYLGTKVPLRDGEGNIVGVVGIGRDITELRQNAEMIRKLNAELEQRVRERTAQLEAANRELEAFSYSVSHDLKAPLRSIEGFSRALREDYGRDLDAAAREFIDRICAASRRMGELIDDLLALSRVTRAEMVRTTVDLSAMAEDIVSELRKSAPERTVRVVIAQHLTVHADPNLLRVAVGNLLANAWKFSSGKAQAEIEVGATRRGQQTAYYVRDNGAGFDMAYVGRLFTAFQRLHGAKEFPGTGVGLATVQRVIYRHGGSVWAEGAKDRGSTFYFTVP
jgi:PAS domain S-box-containing protein